MAERKPVDSLTVSEAHDEFQVLTDGIAKLHEELSSGECGDVNSDAFKVKSQKLAELYARMSQLCK